MGEEKKIQPATTEEQIKEAARRVFTRKGYAATRTRDIADESGHNLALLNYYFRSKEKLFDIIMMETLEMFIKDVRVIITDEQTSLQQKLELIVTHYIDMLTEHPNLPVFILNAINTDPGALFEKMSRTANVQETALVRQWKELAAARNFTTNPIHYLINLIGMTVFPFAARPIIKGKLGFDDAAFNALMEERKKLIPMWIKAMLMGGSSTVGDNNKV